MKDDLIGSAIDIANDIKHENNEKATKLIQEIYDKIDLPGYGDIDHSIFVMVGIRKGRDIYSHGSDYHLRGTQGYSSFDVYQFKLHAESLCNDVLGELE